MPINERTLPNGIRLITEPIAATKTAAVGFWFDAGSRDEGSLERGAAHFVEHMLFRGTARRSSTDLSRLFDRVGGYANAFTERERVCLHCSVPGDRFPEALAALVEMTSESALAPDEIERERAVISSEALAALDDPEETAMDRALADAWGDHPLAFPIAGEPGDVARLGRDEIERFYSDRFAPGPVLVTAAGAVDEDLLATALSVFAGPGRPSVPGEAGPPREGAATAVHPEWRPGRHWHRAGRSQTQIVLSYPIPRALSRADWYAWEALNALVGDTVSSRLFQSLRERLGLCYSVYSFHAFYRSGGAWHAHLATPPDRAEAAIEALLAEVALWRDRGFSDQEIEDAVGHLRGETIMDSEDTENRMKRLARQWTYNGEVYGVEESLARLEAVDSGEVGRVMRGLFRDEDLSLTVYGPKPGPRWMPWNR